MSQKEPRPETDGPEIDVVASVRLSATTDSPRRARRFISEFCRAADMPAELCETAALLVSELVTNAILHGRTAAEVEVHPPADVLRVAVHDDNPSLPEIGERPALDLESGRGLTIVSVLSSRWGIELRKGGKAIWFELDVPRVG